MTALEKPLANVKIISDEKRGNGRWLSLHEVKFTDPSGTERGWEVCRRISPGSKEGRINSGPSIDAVDVITIIKNSRGEATHVALVIQYRPAMGTYTIEFPSGLVDAEEHVSEAALRELEEEVGFSVKYGHSVKVINTFDPIAYEPGITNSCSCAVVVEVVMEQEQLFGPNSMRNPSLEEDEWSLQVAILPLQGLLKTLQELQFSVGGYSKLVLDSRLYTWALGRELGY
ncbi:NUDIX hydrolase domain-like protein [Gamsiella multidivaricata]|uniref:NUDIX hydrolase domain-like protein n=1 Tax=Gamsiella multidivaricata TaxID=101098 RepID=UPI00221EADF0|nr:NUDIX hydrolase domain-like protein [Gamsiella multidivaricata]KAI7818897.1 NUDIX hydrolase domain-like protein [Gamsiella multidivaricata]